jgi:polyhydroxyalkanoate synthesis repressor PhaR
MPIIKRYPNRKLYDTEAKRYVTLDSITQMIHEGQEVQVVDHETGEDLTNLTLSQIIFEQEKKGSGLLPRALLTNLVRAGGDTIEQVRRALLGGAASDVAAKTGGEGLTTDESSPLHKVDDLFQDLLASLKVPTNRDLQRLQSQVDELNRKLVDLLAAEQAAEDSAEVTLEDTAENTPTNTPANAAFSAAEDASQDRKAGEQPPAKAKRARTKAKSKEE